MKILFDNGTPKPIARSLTGHDVAYARGIGWRELENGELIQRAEESGYEAAQHRQEYPIPTEPFGPENRTGCSRQPAMAAGEVASLQNSRRREYMYAGQQCGG